MPLFPLSQTAEIVSGQVISLTVFPFQPFCCHLHKNTALFPWLLSQRPSLSFHLSPLHKVQAPSQANLQITFSGRPPPCPVLTSSFSQIQSLTGHHTWPFLHLQCHSSHVQISPAPYAPLSSSFSLLF